MNCKKILASALCLCLAMPMTTVIPEMVSSAVTLSDQCTFIYDIYQYRKHEDHIEITATSTMAEGEIKVPDIIDGLPVTAIGEHGLAGLSKVTLIGLPNYIKSMGKQTFAGDTNLEMVYLPDVEEIPDEAFLNCANLSSVYIPSSVKKIGERAFYGCKSLTEIKFNNVETIGQSAFDATGLTAITLPNNISVIEEGSLFGCSNITEITLPESVSYIEKRSLPSNLRRLIVLNPECEIDGENFKYISSACTIVAAEKSPLIKFADIYGYSYEFTDQFTPSCTEKPLVSGDANGDGVFNVADIVSVQNYILGNGSLTSYENTDMNNDGRTDVFDYIEMVKKIKTIDRKFLPHVELTATNLTVDIKSKEVEGAEADENFVLGQTDFALQLFKKEVTEDKNTLVSPYSVMQALAMTANGAYGQTRAEMENVLEMPVDDLNKYLCTQRKGQPNDEKCKLSTANSIWAKDTVDVNKEFLQKTVDYYDADFFVAPFDDSTKDDINNWVDEKTDRMIPEILDEIPDGAVMYLVNAVAFDAKWETPFSKYGTYDREFRNYKNEVQKVPFMSATHGVEQISDENAKGIYKYYEGRKYAFAALMPTEMSLTEYIGTLTAEGLAETFSAHKGNCDISIPKFSYDFDTLLNPTLCDMGMPTAFTDYAEFDMIENTSVCINRVIHKTHIDVDEDGTRAGAATLVEMNECCARDRVDLTKPFVYFIIDTETNIPVFIGTLSSIPE